jgi:hypothetical protein
MSIASSNGDMAIIGMYTFLHYGFMGWGAKDAMI